jgi:hypothetical protein
MVTSTLDARLPGRTAPEEGDDPDGWTRGCATMTAASGLPTAWGQPPTPDQVAEALFEVLRRHGRFYPGGHHDLPQPATQSDPGWANAVLRWALDEYPYDTADDRDEQGSEGTISDFGKSGFRPGAVGFDTECIEEPDDYASLVRLFATATGGLWRPENLRAASLEVEGGRSGDVAVVEFDHDGRHIQWVVNDARSDWVQPDFLDCLAEFVDQNIPGRFITLDGGGQDIYFCYISPVLLEELRTAVRWPSPDALVATVRAAAAADLDWGRGETEVLNGFGWLGTWPDLDLPAADGVLALHEAVRLGLPPAITGLLRWGADPRARDGAGKTAFDHTRDRRLQTCLDVEPGDTAWRRDQVQFPSWI